MTNEELDTLEVRLILEAIYARYGYDFRQYAPESIARRLRAALSKTNAAHLGELMHGLLRDPNYFDVVLSCLTVQVTEMFRDPEFHQVFRRIVVPLLRTYPRLSVWHAGCATGEEVYAMAMLLYEEGLYDRTLLYGTDLDKAAVARAKEGIYSEEQAQCFARNYEQGGGRADFCNYFTAAYGKVSVNEGLRRNVSFFQHDLTSDFSLGEMNVVFCRNVALYFNQPLRERVLNMLEQALCRGGFLCLGASESLPVSLRQSFEECAQGQQIFRVRRAA